MYQCSPKKAEKTPSSRKKNGYFKTGGRQGQQKALPNDKGLTLQKPLAILHTCVSTAWHQGMPARKTEN